MTKKRYLLVSILGGFIIALVFFIGGFLASDVLTGSNFKETHTTSDLQAKVQDAYDLMQEDAYDPPNSSEAVNGVLNGVRKSNGDEYGRCLDAKMLSSYTDDMQGEFGGIGVVLIENNGNAMVQQVYPDTPAEKAGIKAGDYFYTIGKETKDNWTSDQVQKAVKGKVGTKIKLVLQRPFTKDEMPQNIKYTYGNPYTVEVTRQIIEVPNTDARMLPGKVGYARLFEFNEKSTDALREAFNKQIDQGATSLILDLRDNPGGDLQQAVGVASLFIDDGPIVSIRARNKSDEVLKATGDTLKKNLPLVVLVNANSASASEIVSGALQDYGRATLIGTKTFGKGCVQTELPFGDGAIFLTTADYFTAKGRDINKKGITPDVTLAMDIEDELAGRGLLNEQSTSELSKTIDLDSQLEKAIGMATEKAK